MIVLMTDEWLCSSAVPAVGCVVQVGWTPLIIASSAGHTDIVTYLLQLNSVDVNAVNSTGQTALHYAASKDRLQVACLFHCMSTFISVWPYLSSTYRTLCLSLWLSICQYRNILWRVAAIVAIYLCEICRGKLPSGCYRTIHFSKEAVQLWSDVGLWVLDITTYSGDIFFMCTEQVQDHLCEISSGFCVPK